MKKGTGIPRGFGVLGARVTKQPPPLDLPRAIHKINIPPPPDKDHQIMPHRVPYPAQAFKTSEEGNTAQDTPGIVGAPAQTKKANTATPTSPRSTKVEESVNLSHATTSVATFVVNSQAATKKYLIYPPPKKEAVPTTTAKKSVVEPQGSVNSGRKRKRNNNNKTGGGTPNKIKRREVTARHRARRDAVIKHMQDTINSYCEELGLPQFTFTKEQKSVESTPRPQYYPPPDELAAMTHGELTAWRANQRQERRRIACQKKKQEQDRLIVELNKQMKKLEERVKVHRTNPVKSNGAISSESTVQCPPVPFTNKAELIAMYSRNDPVLVAKLAADIVQSTPAGSVNAQNKPVRLLPGVAVTLAESDPSQQMQHAPSSRPTSTRSSSQASLDGGRGESSDSEKKANEKFWVFTKVLMK